jgi:hypothetical protein
MWVGWNKKWKKEAPSMGANSILLEWVCFLPLPSDFSFSNMNAHQPHSRELLDLQPGTRAAPLVPPCSEYSRLHVSAATIQTTNLINQYKILILNRRSEIKPNLWE